MKNNTLSLEELKKLRTPLKDVNFEHSQHLTKLEKLASWTTEHVGTMGFFLIIFTWTVLWLSWNIITPTSLHFDPYPAFVLWLFISNMIQLFLMPLSMIGQNLQGRHSEARAESDFEVNVKAEREIETILAHLENQNEITLKILNKLENK